MSMIVLFATSADLIVTSTLFQSSRRQRRSSLGPRVPDPLSATVWDDSHTSIVPWVETIRIPRAGGAGHWAELVHDWLLQQPISWRSPRVERVYIQNGHKPKRPQQDRPQTKTATK